MKKITVPLVLLALCFATGFTCSKNAPQQAAPPSSESAEAAQPATTMAQPTTTTETK